MKTNSSKSQLITTRSKHTIQDNSVIPQTNRKKSQVQSNSRNKSKNMIQTDVQGELETIKNQQLFGIIQTFYNTLCSLPMETLVNSSDPHFWINQQQSTLKELEKKLNKLKKHKDFEYYHWKLNSVQKLLENITDNLTMLQRINNLKGYYSGTETSNYRSRGSSINSEQGEAKIINYQSNPKNQMISYDHYQIKPQNKSRKTEKSNRSDELLAQTIQSEEESDSEQQMVRSEVLQKKQFRQQRKVPQTGQNRNTLNADKKSQSSNFYKIKSKEIQSKDKTLSKIALPKPEGSEKTLSNYTLQDRFLQDRIRTGTITLSNKSRQYPLSVSETGEISKQNYSTTEQPKSLVKQNENEYIAMIKELRCELANKDKEIENLLINQQEFQEGLQIFKNREKEKNMEVLFLKENISNLTRQKEKMQLQINKMKEYQEELKETIKFQRDRNKKEEREKDKIEQKYYEEANTKEQLIQEMNKIKEENKECRKNQRIMKEKLDVYKKKYFKLYGQLQQSKQTEELLMSEIRDHTRMNTLSRYQEIREAVQYQKEKLGDQSF